MKAKKDIMVLRAQECQIRASHNARFQARLQRRQQQKQQHAARRSQY